MKTETVAGKECYVLESSELKVAITKQGGQMAPVTFFLDNQTRVRPYYISPWQEEKMEINVPVLRPLRGDFFCMPFGGNEGNNEGFPPHGETASGEWELVKSELVGTEPQGGEVAQAGSSSFNQEKTKQTRKAIVGKVLKTQLQMGTLVRPGKVIKEIYLVEGHSAVYTRHIIKGNQGMVSLGHHATLGTHNGPLIIRTSPIKFGYTNPYRGGCAQRSEYYSLAPGEKFNDLSKVPTVWKKPANTDCSVFPNREGFIDILQVVQHQSAEPGWVTAVCRRGGYLWFSFKNSALLPTTVFWMENRGRHASPWNGRNSCIGLEDVCAFFADGIPASAANNVLTAEGVQTCHELTGDAPFTVPYIQGTIGVPPDFDVVASVRFETERAVFTAESGVQVAANVTPGFLFGDSL